MLLDLTEEEISRILVSLDYTHRAIEEYSGYPSHEFKHKQISEVTDLIKKIKLQQRGFKRD